MSSGINRFFMDSGVIQIFSIRGFSTFLYIIDTYVLRFLLSGGLRLFLLWCVLCVYMIIIIFFLLKGEKEL